MFDFVGMVLLIVCVIWLKGNVNVLLVIVRLLIVVVFIKLWWFILVVNIVLGIFVFIMVYLSLFMIDFSNKLYCVIIFIVVCYIGLYILNNLKIKEIGRFLFESSIMCKWGVIIVWY